MSGGRSGRPSLIWPALIALFAALAYANSLSNGFALDDIQLVRDNPGIRSPAGIPALFLQPYWPGLEQSGLYRPVTIASFAINRQLTGGGAFGFHLGNLLLHAGVCALAWFVCRGTGRHDGTAFAAATLFAVHPLHTEAVANIAGRAELLAAIGLLVAWLAHRRARAGGEGKGTGWVALAGTAFLLGLLSKEHAVVAPLLFFLDDRLRARGEGGPGRRSLPLAASYLAALAIAVALRIGALGGLRTPTTTIFLDNPLAFVGDGARIGTAIWIQLKYAMLAAWPAALSSDYSHAAIGLVDGWSDPRLWAGLAWAVGLGALFLWGWRRSRTVAVSVACWVLFLLPSSNLLFTTGTAMGERLAYLPSLGACLLAGHVLAWLASPIHSPLRATGSFRVAAPIILLTVLALAGTARTSARNVDWRDNEALALHDVAVQPASAKLQLGAGLAYAGRGEPDLAEEAFRLAVEIYPDYAQAYYNLGQLLMGRGAIEPAIARLERATALAPANPLPYKSLANLHERRGDRERAIAAYAAGTRLDPADLAMRFNFGRALLAEGRTPEAVQVLRSLAGDAPRAIEGALATALLAETEGRTGDARLIYRALLARTDVPGPVADNLRRRLAALD